MAAAFSRYSGTLGYFLVSGGMGIAVLATVAAVAGALAGMCLKGAGQGTRIIVPFAGGLLVGISVFGLFPELVVQMGWARGLALFGTGYLLLLGINRYLFPVCPSCSHDHNHDVCAAALHGFAGPLLSAAVIHSALDGWSIVTAQWAAPAGVRLTLPLAVALHKVPEGIALGAILRAALPSRATAFAWCVVAEGATLVGGAAGLQLAPLMGQAWLSYPLAIAGGVFFYLGFHAVHGEWKRRGA
ncbi:MAG: zinc/iron permease, partial [Bryobacterales bacterium]|nr:zinc/iron permease [Bryobacterales bacterium]